jgi:putative ABC transport system substrate-binding protein
MIYDELSGKIVELLKEAVPTISRVAVLWNPNHADPEFRETQRAASTSGVELQSLEVRTANDFAGAFDAALRQHAEGLIIVSARLLLQQRRQIVEFGSKNRIIMAGNWEEWAKDGLLFTYGPSTSELMRRVAGYMDKILKGAKPTDLRWNGPPDLNWRLISRLPRRWVSRCLFVNHTSRYASGRVTNVGFWH